ncbi:MAG: dicarboxylate/amino acid:cation symporter [Xanthomonadales bacterium]|nr:dicarboxylate/amino acid:cation symporter [Xanthomonadales bacterium]
MLEQKRLSLSSKIFIAMILGAVLGSILNLMGTPEWSQIWLIDGLFGVAGQVFISLLKMLVVPLVFVSLICGVSSLSDPKVLGRVGGKTVGLYMFTTGFAVTIALTAALVFEPGIGATPVNLVQQDIAEVTPFTQVLVDMVPNNPVAAMADAKMLPIIFFAILLGLAITMSGEAGKRISGWFEDFNQVIMKLVTIVMRVAPYGVFALIANLAATSNGGDFLAVGRYIVLVLAVLVFHALVFYPTLLVLLTRLDPRIFLYKMRAAMLFGFSTASSNATIPVTLESVVKRIGVSNKVASFTVPLGATINMDGTAIMQGIATGFIAQFYGIDLGISQYLMVVLMVIMASIGTAGIPSVGLVLLAGVLAQVGLPEEGIALILGVDRLLDMTRTVVNITGDATVTTIVGKSEGELDETVFNDPRAAGDFETGSGLK